MVSRYLSSPLDLPPADHEVTRADLVFYGVDHSGSSFVADVYLDLEEGQDPPGHEDPRYAGSFTIFGHGGCFGDAGHCDVPTAPRDPFDRRPPHQLTPQAKVVIATDAVRRLLVDGGREQTTVTVVAHTPGDRSDAVLAFEQLRLLTYK